MGRPALVHHANGGLEAAAPSQDKLLRSFGFVCNSLCATLRNAGRCEPMPYVFPPRIVSLSPSKFGYFCGPCLSYSRAFMVDCFSPFLASAVTRFKVRSAKPEALLF